MSLPLQDLASLTSMASSELKRTLQTLACAKYKVLTKNPKGRDVDDTDQFSFNDSFTSPLAKIKIMTIASRVESTDERRETDEKIDEMRNTQCDVSASVERVGSSYSLTHALSCAQACIVRVMKDRKQLQHSELVNEVIQQLSTKFQPSLPMIKKSIERLIGKEYLERDEQDRRSLRYLVSASGPDCEVRCGVLAG